MEMLLYFLGGALLASAIAFFVARSIIRSRALALESNYKAELAKLTSDLEHATRQVIQVREEAQKQYQSSLKAQEDAHRKAMEELEKRFDLAMTNLKGEVEIKTGEMLKSRQEEFSKKSTQDIDQILKPLKEKIGELKEEMKKGTQEQIDLKAKLETHVSNMLKQSEAARKSADDLAAAFMYGSKVRGDWGETMLEELLASQGLVRGVNFDTQYVVRDSKGVIVKSDENHEMRLDVILHLGDNRDVIVDSKVSLKAYVDYVNADNEEDRRKFLKEHIDSIRKHVRELAHKDYSSYIQPPKMSSGFVMMFVPNAGALWVALREEPSLWRWAADMNVYIADEQSLYGALKIVDLTWTQVKQAQNHQKVFELADEMIKRVGEFVVRYNALGESLKKTVETYASAGSKLSPEGQSIVTSAQKLVALGADSKQLVAVRSNKKETLAKVLKIDTAPLLEDTYE